MKISNSNASTNRIMQHHKIVNLGALMGNNISSPPKLECRKCNKTYNIESDYEYEKLKKTHKYLCSVMAIEEITIDKMKKLLCDNIEKEGLDIHEIYTILASYSLWECIEYLIDHNNPGKISKNHHKFNILHKALLPVWLWNYRNTLKEMPANLSRTTHDVYKTIEILISNELTPSVLESTPRVLSNEQYTETSIVILTRAFPRNLIATDYAKIYDILVHPPTEKMIKQEIMFIISEIMSENYIHEEKLGNELKWIILLSPSNVASQIIEELAKLKKDKCVRKLMYIIDLLFMSINSDGIFDDFFATCKWNKKHIQNLMDNMMCDIRSKNMNDDLINAIDNIITLCVKKNNFCIDECV